ncbi:MAG: glycosyltransferase 87 family protein [Actinomycetota bacterium]|nr:glycosyltransferase 87 family protein [Actinomycetota bacterium]
MSSALAPQQPPQVLPSRDDPVVLAASEVVGGPAGRRARPGRSWWTPVRVLLVLTFLAAGLGVLAKEHCRAAAWSRPDPDQYVHQCYSDIPLLYSGRGLDQGVVPYVDDVPEEQAIEYPVLTGAVMGVTAALVPGAAEGGERARWYFDLNVLLLAVAAAVTVVATARTVPWRPWDAALVALAPGTILAGTINWDLHAVALTALALLAWARRRPGWAGVALGLATAAKFYPVLLLGPLLLLALRTGRWRAAGLAVLTAAGAWLAVNVPVMLLNAENWSLFYRFSSDRPAGFGSIWYALQLRGLGVPPAALNAAWQALFAACCLGIAVLALAAPRRPRLASLAFLTVAAFVLTTKVYSPQYVVWLVPLAALARPRWRDFLIWQACEVVHFFGTWLYLVGLVSQEQANRALSAQAYVVAVVVHVVGTLWLAGVVIRDILRPAHDPVRADGSDDPTGGEFDAAPDALRLAGARRERTGQPRPALES